MKEHIIIKGLLFVLGIIFSSTLYAEGVELKITHGPYLQNLSTNEVSILWTTNRPCKSWVEYVPKSNDSFYLKTPFKVVASIDGLCTVDTLHCVTMKNLQEATTYLYRIVSQEVKALLPYRSRMGDVVSSNILKKPLSFTTINSQRKDLEIFMVSDIHGDNEMLKKLLDLPERKNTDLVLYCGDMCNYIDTQEEIFKTFLDTSIKLFASCQPFVYVRGNHETRGAFARQFHRYFKSNNDRHYYAFSQGNVRFVVLDGGEDKPDGDLEYSGLIDFDSYILIQKEWLAKEVASREFLQAKFKVVLSHIPFPLKGWYGSKRMQDAFQSILDKVDVDIMLSGHNHAFGVLEKGPLSNFPVIVNSHKSYLTLSVFDAKMKVVVKEVSGKLLFEKEYTK